MSDDVSSGPGVAAFEPSLGVTIDGYESIRGASHQALVAAASEGNIDTVRYMLAADAEVPKTDALFIAIEGKHKAIVQLLLDAGASANMALRQPTGAAWSPLAAAAVNNETHLLQCLINHGSDVNLVLEVGESRFTKVPRVPCSREPMLDHRKTRGAPQSALVVAAAAGHLEAVQCLVSAGASVDPPMPSMLSALTAAAAHGHVEVLKYLLDAGACVNPQLPTSASEGKEGEKAALETPLFMATYHGHMHIVGMLLERGADPSLPTWGRHLPLYQAVRFGRRDIVGLLLQHGADTSAFTLLTRAVGFNHVDILSDLLDAGAPVLGVDDGGKSALFLTNTYTTQHTGLLTAVRMLLRAGADANRADASGLLPLEDHLTNFRDHTRLVDLAISLLAAGSSITSTLAW